MAELKRYLIGRSIVVDPMVHVTAESPDKAFELADELFHYLLGDVGAFGDMEILEEEELQ